MLEIHSKDETKSAYDYAKEYYDIEKLIESEEKRKITSEERLMIFAILLNEEG